MNKLAFGIVPATTVGIVGGGGQGDGAGTATGNVSGWWNTGNSGYGNLNGGVVAVTVGNRVNRTNVKNGDAGQVAGSQRFEYNSLMETLYLMSSRDTMADIRKAEQDIKEGKGIEVNLDELWD